ARPPLSRSWLRTTGGETTGSEAADAKCRRFPPPRRGRAIIGMLPSSIPPKKNRPLRGDAAGGHSSRIRAIGGGCGPSLLGRLTGPNGAGGNRRRLLLRDLGDGRLQLVDVGDDALGDHVDGLAL